MNLWSDFVAAVETHFDFLEREFGFTRTLTKQPNVIYESDKVQVQLYYDAEGRHELDLGLRRLANNIQKPLSLTIGMLMRLRGQVEDYVSPFPSIPKVLEAEVRRLAELLRKYGDAVLRGDLRDFEKIERLERELAAKFGTPKK